MEAPTPKNKPRGFVWDSLCRGTDALYNNIIRSRFGRIMTGYRRVDRALLGGRCHSGRHRTRPMSPARYRVVESVEEGRLFEWIRRLVATLVGAPLTFYGFLCLFYGILCTGLYFILPRFYGEFHPGLSYLIVSVAMAIASLPMILSHASLSDGVGNSRCLRWFFVSLLGIPAESFNRPRRKMSVAMPYVAFLLAVAAAVVTIWIHPAVIPLAIAVIGIGGMIFAYPEAGVILSTALLPILWLHEHTILIVAPLILLTWVSYGLKLLLLHRTIRFGVLDLVLLLFGVVLLSSGFTGAVVNAATMTQGVLLFICFSDYFLIVNLMNSRTYIRRCLVGVAASVVLVTVLAYLRLVPQDGLSWLEGSRAGNAIVAAFSTAMQRLSGLWVEHSEVYLVLVFPWLYAYLLHTRRLFRRVAGLVFVALGLILIWMTNSISALVCVLCVTLLFFLLFGHKWMARGIVALPLVGCAVFWLGYLYPVPDAVRTILSRSRLYKDQLWDSLWHMVLDHPGGIGLGDEAFAKVYPAYAAPDLGAVTDSGGLLFEVLLNFGWAGLLILLVFEFLFVQKSLTALLHTSASRDRAVILGGMASLLGVLIFGTVRSFLVFPRVLYTLMLVVALSSAYANVLFDESDVLTATSVGTPCEEDRIYRNL